MSLFQVDSGREWRGGQRQSLFLVRELKRRGFPCLFVVQPGSPLFKKASEEGLPVHPLPMRSELDLRAIFQLARLMSRRNCVLAHFHDAHSVAIGTSAASLAKVPLRIASRRVDFPLRSPRKYKKRVDSIIAISEGVKKVLIKNGIPERLIEVIPSGIDFKPYDEARHSDYLRREFHFAPDDYLIGIVAQLEDHKGHTYLIQATKILKGHAPKIKVIVVGSGSLQMDLDKEAHDLAVEDIVYFLGFRQDIPQILSSLDLFVLSSHMEGMGSSLLDAMACRLPIVATMVGGIPEVVIHRETGLLVPPRDPGALAEAILKLYLDRTFAARLGERGYEVVHERFSAEVMAAKIIALYEKLAAEKKVQLKPGA